MHNNRRVDDLIAEAESWIKWKREITPFHNAMAFACLLEAEMQRDIGLPNRYTAKRGRPPVGKTIAKKLAQNPALVEEL